MTKAISVVKYIVVILVLAGVVAGAMFLASKNKMTYSAPTPNVYVALPVKRTVSETVSFGTHIEARAMIPVVPLVSGTITEYPAKAGDYVEAGDLLALIDEKPFRQQMLQARAAYTGYESNFKRVSGLYRAGAATRQEYDTLESQRDAARAQYELAQLQLGYTRVTAPSSGTILAAPLAVGNIGNQQQPVALIADLQDLVIRLQVPEKYFSLFAINSKTLSAEIVRETNNSMQEKCTATVDSVAPYVDARSKTFETVFQLSDAPETFRPGMYVRIVVTFRQHENAPALPVVARKTDGSCYIFTAENKSSAKDVQAAVSRNETVGGSAEHIIFSDVVSDGEWFIVPDEYAERLFIIEGQGSVFNGQKVSAVAMSQRMES